MFDKARTALQSLFDKAWFEQLILIGSLAVILFSSFLRPYVDEADNFLGGLLINQGKVPYVDFFSHHMPFPYFLSADITAITGNNLVLYRLAFAVISIGFIFLTYRIIRKGYSRIAEILFIALYSIVYPFIWANMLIAETIVANLVMLLTVVFLFDFLKPDYIPTLRHTALVTIAGAIIPLTSLGFLFVAALFIGSYWIIIFQKGGSRKLKLYLTSFGIIALASNMLFSFLWLTNSIDAFIFSNLHFNTQYYSIFHPELENSFTRTYSHAFARTMYWIPGIFLHLNSVGAVISALIVLSFVALTLVLIKGRKWLVLLGSALLLISVNMREGGLSDTLGSDIHGIVHYMLVVLLLSIGIVYAYRSREVLRNKWVSNGILSLLAVTLVLISLYALKGNYTITKRAVTNKTYISTNPTPRAEMINRIVDENEYAWSGPFDIATFTHMKAKNPSKYTFFLPWLSACEDCTNEFINDLESKNTKVIYWKPGVKLWESNADNSPVFDYIKSHYFTVDKPHLRDYYFNNECSEELEKKLETI
jgi:hypothetical protein